MAAAEKELSIIVRARQRLQEGFRAAVQEVRKFRQSVQNAGSDTGSLVGKFAQTGAVIAALDGATKLVRSGLALARGDAEAFHEAFSGVPVLGHAYKLGAAIREAVTGEVKRATEQAEKLKQELERVSRLNRIVQVLDRNAKQIRDLRQQYKDQRRLVGLSGITKDLAPIHLEYEQELRRLKALQEGGGGLAMTEDEYRSTLTQLRELRDARIQAVRDAHDKEAQESYRKAMNDLADYKERQRKEAEEARKKNEQRQKEELTQRLKEHEIRSNTLVANLKAEKKFFEAELEQLREKYRQRLALAKTASEREALVMSQSAEEVLLAKKFGRTGHSKGISGQSLSSRYTGAAEVFAARRADEPVVAELRRLRAAQDRVAKAAERTANASERLAAAEESDIEIGVEA